MKSWKEHIKTIDINIHIEKVDEVAYNDTAIETEIHLNDINFIENRSSHYY